MAVASSELDMEIVELLPPREEVAWFIVPRITVVGAIIQNNINVTIGNGSPNFQANSLVFWIQ
jgi:hypothetical protein